LHDKEVEVRKLKQLLIGLAVVAIVGAGAVGAATGAGSRGAVKVGSSSLGRVLVDAHGKTLYMWAHDRSSQSTCYGDCATYWPPLVTRGQPVALAGAKAGLLGTSRRTDGRMQVTYAGHPLYSFVQDTKPGDVKGEGLTGFGGRWDPVSPAGTPVQAAPSVVAGVLSPAPGAVAGAGGQFTVDLSLAAANQQGNAALAGYKPGFVDPNSPAFHPGTNADAPGLVVLLSTTPRIANTPLKGPNTNLAGVFQINDVSKVRGLMRTFHSWIVTSPGFFGKGVQATLTAYAVNGTAPAVVDGSEKPISNVVRESFTIAG
jgi:predicted lipoprotein with Yx(FWY)xxD motif